MKQFSVVIAGREIHFYFSHPWVRTNFRGLKDVPVKTTSCTIVEPRESAGKDGRPRFRFISFGRIKWPLVAPVDSEGNIKKAESFSTSPGALLSRSEAKKLALKEALKGKFNRSERKVIWNAFFGKQPPETVPPVTPAPTTVEAVPGLHMSVPRESHKVIMFPARAGKLPMKPDTFFMQRASGTIH